MGFKRIRDRKAPGNTQGKVCDATDPNNHCNFETIVSTLESGTIDGLNYVLGFDDVVGIDIDGVVDPVTGEILDGFAVELLKMAEAEAVYTEKSPSGSGLRMFCKGGTPDIPHPTS